MSLTHRDETEGSWIDLKKPTLKKLPMLDINAMNVNQVEQLEFAYDQYATHVLLPISEIGNDPVRKDIDMAITNALGLPDITPLRAMLAREPVICLYPLY